MTKANIKDLLSKPTIIITAAGEIPIHPMGLGIQAEIAELLKTKDNTKAAMTMVMDVLKRAFPEATVEDLDQIDAKIITQITEAALEVNGLASEGKKSLPEEEAQKGPL